MTSPVPPLLYDEPPRRSLAARIVRILILLAVVASVTAAGRWWWNSRGSTIANTAATGTGSGPASASAVPMDTLMRAPTGVRVRVRVVNATGIDGLAKRATNDLRDLGFDVVDFDSEKKKNYRATTLVETHTGHTDWGNRVVRALGVGTVENRPDSSRYIDLTVIIGSDWKPSPKAFSP